MDESTKIKIEQIVEFRKVILAINSELKSKGIYDCEYMLINNSIEDVIHVLENESKFYDLVKNEKYPNNMTFKGLLESYFVCVKKYYETILIKNGDADQYHKKLIEPIKDGRKNYLIYDKDNVGMGTNDIKKTLLLMKEAVQAYYKVYYNKEVIAELTTNNAYSSEYFTFKIKEDQLLHLLGVTIGQLKNNPDFHRLTGKKGEKMKSIDVLHWILTDIDGNQDLLQYSEDFLKKISSTKEFRINYFQSSSNTQLLNYYKVRSKSQTFLKYGPFEKISLVAKLGKDSLGSQKTLSKNSNSTVAMVTRAETFKKYPWAYFGLVNKKNDQYIETLQIDSSEHKKELFMYSKPAIIKKIGLVDPDDGGGGSSGESGSGDGEVPSEKIFSEDEQFELFWQAYTDFSTTMDFTNLINYFEHLSYLGKKMPQFLAELYADGLKEGNRTQRR